jgi:MFS family permease
MVSRSFDGLRGLLAQPRFRRLLATRLTSQAADGIYQTSLAGAVLFNPQHHTGAGKVAAGLVILLLPYSLIGPFAGVLLDRWRRQRVLTYGATVHAALVVLTAGFLLADGPSGVGFALSALAALAVNRFYLAALSASLPNVVAPESLVLGNAVGPTAGTVLTIIGAGIGLAIRAIAGSGDHGNATVALAAAVVYLAAATVSASLPGRSLGPTEPAADPVGSQLLEVLREFTDGARHILARRTVARALGVIAAQRFGFGLWTIMTLLLYRNTFHTEGPLHAGLGGVGQAVTVGGIGLVLGAVATPRVTATIGGPKWISALTAGLAVSELAFGAPFAMPFVLVSALALGFATQATKVCVDTIAQADIEDVFRGRVFAVYDTAFNLSFVAAALVAAAVLPASGKSLTVVFAMSGGYAVLALWYAAASRDRATSQGRQDAEHAPQQT